MRPIGRVGVGLGLFSFGLGGCAMTGLVVEWLDPQPDSPASASWRFSPDAILELESAAPVRFPQSRPLTCAPTRGQPQALVFGGGGAPSYNEIAIEKNVRYFQRTLKTLGIPASNASIYFANGNDGAKTVRYIDPKTGKEQFKTPEIPGVLGAVTIANLDAALATLQPKPKTVKSKTSQSQTSKPQTPKPLFFYFTGHGNRNPDNIDNNSMIFWDEVDVSVQDFATRLDRLPVEQPVVTVMVQCYAGAFANFIYQQGDRQRPVALQTRCGFFATIKQRPSVGCTPSVDEADYEDYSSSFFAGLSGVDRVGKPVASADYDGDGRVSFSEAHGFAKVDEQAADLPLSTAEAWLRDGFDGAAATMDRPIAQLLATARPEQAHVLKTFIQTFELDVNESFATNVDRLPLARQMGEWNQTRLTRLQLELINIAAEQAVRQRGDQAELAVLDRLLICESGSWR